MIKFRHSGNFKNTEKFLERAKRLKLFSLLEEYAKLGVSKLSEVTPVDTGKTANSWSYTIKVTSKGFSIEWLNTNIADNNVPVVILLEYGHGTLNGGFVSGRNFINSAIQPVMDALSANLWKEVTKL